MADVHRTGAATDPHPEGRKALRAYEDDACTGKTGPESRAVRIGQRCAGTDARHGGRAA